jgi:predicted HNH restriction endonuclease
MAQTERKIKYDREYDKRKYEKYKQERKEVLESMGNCCEVCGLFGGQLHLHHKYYDEKSDYPRTSNGWSRIRRVREAKAEPEKFALLCNKCHKSVHWAVQNKDKLLKLLSLYSPSEDL